MKSFQVKLARTAAERERIFHLRYKVYVEEQKKIAYLANVKSCQVIDSLDDRATQLYLEGDDGDIIGCLRLNWGEETELPDLLKDAYQLQTLASVPAEQRLYVSRLIIAPEARRSLAILELPMSAYLLASRRGIKVAFLNAAENLLSLYGKLGYRAFGREFLEPGIGARHPMLLLLEDVRHLKCMKSPFLKFAPAEPTPFVRSFHSEHPFLFADPMFKT